LKKVREELHIGGGYRRHGEGQSCQIKAGQILHALNGNMTLGTCALDLVQ